MITIGIDPHKASHTAAAVNDRGQVMEQLRVPAGTAAVRRLLDWAAPWPQRRWAVE